MKQRQAGFIRNYSSKQISEFQQEPLEFSYFRPRPPNDQKDEFSPYKVQERTDLKTKIPLRPPLPLGKRKQAAVDRNQSREPKEQGEQIYKRLKERMGSYEQRKDKSKQKLQQNIGNIRNKIEQLDCALQELKASKSSQKLRTSGKVQQRLVADLKDSSSSSSVSEEIIVNSIPSPKLSIEKPTSIRRQDHANLQPKQSQSRKSNQKQQNERGSSLSKRQNIITFNSRVSNQPPLQIKSYSSSSEEELYPNRQQSQQSAEQSNYLAEKKRTSAQKVEGDIIQANLGQQTKKEYYKNKGGVCFDIDTKQFTEPIPLPREERVVKKVNKVDKKTQILRRRQTAKAYDRMTRRALFTAYN